MNRKPQVVEGTETRAIERLIVDTQFKIHQLMKDEGVSKADLARRLNCSKSRVSQMFGDKPNLTLETLAKVFFALNDECRVGSDRTDAIVKALRQGAKAMANSPTRPPSAWRLCDYIKQDREPSSRGFERWSAVHAISVREDAENAPGHRGLVEERVSIVIREHKEVRDEASLLLIAA